MPGEPDDSFADGRAAFKGSGIVDSFSQSIRRAEAQLAQQTPSSWRAETSIGDILQKMRRLGIQTLLDESTSNNSLDDNTLVRLSLHNASIDANLRFALMPFDCDYTISDSGVVRIMSNDALLEFDTFLPVTYDVGALASDYEGASEVAEVVERIIDPDNWEENGGEGRIAISPSKNGYLLVINHTYQHQRQIRQLLQTHLALGGGERLGNSSQVDANLASRPVQLPEQYMAQRRNRRGMALPGSGTTGGFGGGSGLGGGVF